MGAALKTRPPSFDLGLKKLRASDFDGALTHLRTAADEAPSDAIVLAALASAQLGAGDPAAAGEAYRQALGSASPAAQAPIHFGLGEAFRIQEEDELAAISYRKAMNHAQATADIKKRAKARLELVD